MPVQSVAMDLHSRWALGLKLCSNTLRVPSVARSHVERTLETFCNMNLEMQESQNIGKINKQVCGQCCQQQAEFVMYSTQGGPPASRSARIFQQPGLPTAGSARAGVWGAGEGT